MKWLDCKRCKIQNKFIRINFQFKFFLRRDRNSRLNNGANGYPFMSEGSGNRSGGDSDCFCRPHSSNNYVGVRRRCLPPPCTSFFLLFVVGVVASFFSLTYFAVSLQGQISTLTMHLEAGKTTIFHSDSRCRLNLELL